MPERAGAVAGAASRAAPPAARSAGARRRFVALPLRVHLLALVALVLLPAIGVGAFTSMYAVQAHAQAAEERLSDTARAIGLALAADLGKARFVAETLSASPLLGGGEEAMADYGPRARRLADSLGSPVFLLTPGPQSRLALDSRAPGEAPRPVSPATAQLLERALAAGRTVLSDLGNHPLLGGLGAIIVSPVRAPGAPYAAVAVAVAPQRLAAILEAQGLAAQEFATLVDAQGMVVARAPDHLSYYGRAVPDWFAAAAGDAAHGLVIGPAIDGTLMVFAHQQVPGTEGWRVVVAEPLTQHEARWRRPLATMALGGGLALLIGLVAALSLSRHLVESLAGLLGRHEPGAETGGEGRQAPGDGSARARAGGLRILEYEAVEARLSAAAERLRREAEAAQRGQALLRSVLEASADPVFVRDAAGRYVVANPAAEAMLGHPAAVLLGRTDAELGPGLTDPEEASDARVMAERAPLRLEKRLPGVAGGMPRVFQLTKAPWRDPASGTVAGVVGVARDDTARREAERRAATAEEAMQHLARRATACALASGIAHELNQPLSAAAMYLAGARRLLATHPEQAEAGLERAAAQVQRAGAVLRGLRGFLHGGPVRRHEERLGPVVAEALELALSATPGFDRAALTLDSDPGLPPLAMDRVQVQQVVVNLVRNAMEAVTEAPPGPARRIAVTVRAEGSGAAVTIADTGPGLPPSVRARLFEPFVTTRPEGLGLGLSICRTLVEAHGGQIQARAAEAGPGTAFAFTLPRDGGLGTPAAAVA